MTEEDVLEGQPCPMCHKNTLTLRESAREIPYFGTCYTFSMDCTECDYGMADVEFEDTKGPVKYTLDVTSEDDLNIRIVKSSHAKLKIPRMIEVTPGPMSEGYVSNVEGVLTRIKKVIESQKDDDDPSVRKKVKNQLKKLQRVLWGKEPIQIILEDKTGNSAIISDKAKKS